MSTTGGRPAVTQYTPEATAHLYEERGGSDWVLFAAVMLAILGALNLTAGVAAVANSDFFIDDARFILGGLNTWGWVMIAVGATQLLVAIGVRAGATGVRWVGVAIAAANAIVQLFFIQAYPWISVMLFGLGVLVIYGLVVHGGRPKR
jgi:hypothetical protein